MTTEANHHSMRFVLDTNCFRGLPVDRVKELGARGIPVRVSEIALRETLARAAREYRNQTMTLAQAQGLFASRLRSLWPLMEQERPVAYCGTEAVLYARANQAGESDPLHRSYDDSAKLLRQMMSALPISARSVSRTPP